MHVYVPDVHVGHVGDVHVLLAAHVACTCSGLVVEATPCISSPFVQM